MLNKYNYIFYGTYKIKIKYVYLYCVNFEIKIC